MVGGGVPLLPPHIWVHTLAPSSSTSGASGSYLSETQLVIARCGGVCKRKVLGLPTRTLISPVQPEDRRSLLPPCQAAALPTLINEILC